LIDEYLIYDMNGQLIARELIHQTRKFELAIENPGLFVIELFSEGRLIGRNKISVIR
jgi:hypothetical protein